MGSTQLVEEDDWAYKRVSQRLNTQIAEEKKEHDGADHNMNGSTKQDGFQMEPWDKLFSILGEMYVPVLSQALACLVERVINSLTVIQARDGEGGAKQYP
ncbi:hypothetical protein FGB62_76g070 [Gracilaria domingensis]|nr:hypothetical protein FGB62_76g070 [Gracilaria domingensis]